LTLDRRGRNRRTALLACLVIVGMLGLTAASVPLYRLFCQVSGFGGTPRIDANASAPTAAQTVIVQFNADVAPGMPWLFRPAQRSMTVPLGEQTLAFYEAVNRSDHPVVGHAVFNVTPFKVGPYFVKLQCFCFDEQTLQAGQRAEMPVSFYVDPAMMTDGETSEVGQITLSYTFYIDREATAKLRAGGSTS
jgi:cytochrome c oxidase assembly protein subunit 11